MGETILIEIYGNKSKFRGLHKDTAIAKKAAVKIAGKRDNVDFVIAKVQSTFSVVRGEIKR